MAWLHPALQDHNMKEGLGLVAYVAVMLLLVVTTIWHLKRRKWVKLIDEMPGPRGLPIIGCLFEINVDPAEVFVKICSYCDFRHLLMKVWIGPLPYLAIYKAEAAEVILSNPNILTKSRDYAFMYSWLGDGLLLADGQKWHSRRKMLTPAFHFKILEEFVEVFNRQSATLVEKLSPLADGNSFNISPYICLCTLDIICETALGGNIHAQDNDSEYVKAVYKVGRMIQHRQVRPWLHFDFTYKLFGYAKEHSRHLEVIHSFSHERIQARRRELEESKLEEFVVEEGHKKRLAFLDLLLEYSDSGRVLTDEEIRKEVDTFMVGGHDSTAMNANWTLYLLGWHPEIQAQVYEEIYSLIGDSDRDVTLADIRELKCLERCIKEALRLFPPIPIVGRELKEEITIGKYRVPIGTTALIITYQLHRDPNHFPDPERFDPDRFLPENCKNRHPYAYIPFSAGPRNCIGQKFAQIEEKILLTRVLRKFRVKSIVRREELKVIGELVLRPQHGNFVQLFPRD